LLQERRELSEERQQFIKTHEIYDTQLKGMDVHLQQRGKEIQELRQLFEARYQQLDGKIEYVLVRMSIKERIRARLFKFLKAVHLLVPKRLREKYRFHYRRFFFEKVFPDGQRFEARDSSYSVPSSNSAVEKLDLFVQDVVRNRSQLMVVYTTDPYLETRGQRSTWLTKEFVRRGIPVIFFYWRWDPKEAVAESGDPLVVQVPIDEFSKVQEQLFSSGPNLERIFLIEFPDARLFEKINLANAHSFITIFDCVDDWEEFAKAGQALWYDAAVERYLVRNANLVVATNQRLAQKLKEMGASHVPIIPNGVDLNSFDPKTEKAGLQRGTLTAGYFGHLTESWFDWDVVTKTAQARKDWVFHIIGYGEPSGLKLPENVCFWGRVEHRDLPAYARIWDVAMIPFKEGRLTEAVDPIKLYEYLHLGLPVVATNMDHLCGTPGVYPCLRDDFEKALVLAKRTPFPRQEAERFVRSNTWEKRADRLLEEIDRVDLSGDVLKSIG
jgi:glycosyltransferase involved in cell wall biosynthesis